MESTGVSPSKAKQLANLKPPFPKGVSGNPEGKPPGIKNRATIVREILDLEHAEGQTYEYASTLAIAKKAVAGDVQAWDKLMDSAHGKIADKSELTGKDGGAIETKGELSALDKVMLQQYVQSLKPTENT